VNAFDRLVCLPRDQIPRVVGEPTLNLIHGQVDTLSQVPAGDRASLRERTGASHADTPAKIGIFHPPSPRKFGFKKKARAKCPRHAI
jgi:hypothetical protein